MVSVDQLDMPLPLFPSFGGSGGDFSNRQLNPHPPPHPNEPPVGG